MLEGIILGSGATRPSADRLPSAILLKVEGLKILLDCGEGAQHQLMKFGEPFFADVVVLSHHHTDHVHGLKPYLESMNLLDRKEAIDIFTPDSRKLAKDLADLRVRYKMNVIEVKPGISYIKDKLSLKFYKARHGEIPAVSVYLQGLNQKRYDRKKLLAQPIHVRKELFLTGRSGDLLLGDYVLPSAPRYALYYSGDTAWQGIPSEVHEKATLIHECTYVRSEDKPEARKRAHTHLEDIIFSGREYILSHLGDRVGQRRLETSYPLPEGSLWAYDGLRFTNKIW